MRFKSVLLLLFLTGALFGQSNCLIADLTANFIAASPANPCQYFISLSFQHTATTNQYTVTGNGNNYGTFSYSQDPVTLGPFTAGNTPITREFVVRDAVFQDCQDQVTIEIPACSAAPCEIYDLTAQPGDCNSNTGTYNLTLNFQVANPTNGKFDLWAGNGAFLGSYGLNELPLHVSNFPWGGGTTDELKVCINDNQNCCRSIAFDAPSCFVTNPCNISNLEVIADSCTSDTTYRLKFNFHVTGVASSDSFALYGNGHFIGNYALAQLPVTIPNFHWDGGAVDYIKVCLLTPPPNGQPCCLTTEYHVPDCLIPCGINGLHVNVDSCTTDSTFRISLNFNVNDPSVVDSFDLWGNSHYLGHFGMNQLPLSLDSFLWNGLVVNQIRVCTGNTPACCKELTFLAPNCLPFGPCEITDIFTVTGACTSDSTYKVRFFFNATNPGNGTYTAYAGNGTVLGTYPLTHIPLEVDSFPWSGNILDVIKICINPDTPGTALCCRTKEFKSPACLQPAPCEIFDLTAVPGDCNPTSPTYSLVVNFQVQNPGNQSFEVWANNGVYMGSFPLSQLPLTIPNFPASGNQFDLVKVCINDHPDCCRAIEFHSPCVQAPCSISGLVVETGDCTGDSTYHVVINFQATNPLSNSFTVWANGNLFGTYNLNQLPLAINNFPWNGGVNDVVKVCFMNATGAPDCCATKEFPVPACLNPGPCEIFNLTAVPGDCIPGTNTYSLVINFQVQNPGNQFFEVRANNGVFIGTYPLSQLPLTIPNFPASGNQFDLVKVCINDHPDCCRAIEFHSPCVQAPCSISGLNVVTGDCTSDSTYHVVINFQATNPLSNTFTVWANGNLFGTYNLNQLPLAINNFPWNGGVNDIVKVCFMNAAGAPDCCATKEFPVPACLNPGPCEIFNLTAVPGDCNPATNTYTLVINFQVQNPGNQFFEVRANNGVLIGTYPLSQLPLTIPNFPASGNQFDLVKVCINDHPNCCRAIEFLSPCTSTGNCSIHNLEVLTGDCTGDSTYQLKVNFAVTNPPSNNFTVWANGVQFGNYNLSQLPLMITNFPWNGGVNDVIKICFETVPGTPPCCETREFPVPGCLDPSGPCAISNLVVETGTCSSDSTYKLSINFTVTNPPSNIFSVWANNGFLGLYNINQLPIGIPNFPWNGGANDVVKVCFGNGGVATCCAVREFPVPDCLTQTGNCEIHNLNVTTGDCTSNTTYQLGLNFSVSNPPSNVFEVWANGVLFGTYNLSQLPLSIPNFPSDGGVNDVVKVCMVPNTPTSPACCAVKEFPVPDCIGNNPCEIWDLHVVHTPCLCGQFFALVSFNSQNGGTGGFDVTVNGNPAGNFPYNTPQPIILGPFNGDGTTVYHFKVTDHQHADCNDEFEMGKVECMSPVVSPANDAKLVLSPNPAADWISVNVQMNGAAKAGQTKVDIFHADGRLVQTQIVGDGSNFQLDISGLPAGMYRIVLQTEAGRLEGTFAKQ